MKKFAAVLSLFILCMPLFSKAHPGHGDTDGYTIIHYIVEPAHALVWVLTFTVLVFFAWHKYRSTRRNEKI